ncbi:MAG TPA: serine hydrolase domain-containing protein [Thermoanaerobaculia bacterium]|jgi:CubicO group peptidase (beta-lactamase class C family)
MSDLTRREFVATTAVALAATRAQRAQRSPSIAPPAALLPVRAYIEEKVSRGIVPSLAVALSRDGKLLWSEAFGFADLEERRAATPDTIYKLASLSKPITATALMTLVDRGLVALDAPANDYLRGAKLRAHAGSASEITVRRLLNHTAGIPTHENLFYDNVPTLPRDETIRRHGFAAWPPGSRFHYSNLGTAILGFITEDVAGVPWETYLERAVFRPLGMSRSGLYPRRDDASINYDYDVAARFVRTGEHTTDHPGGSSLRSTVHDLLRFLHMHLRGGAPLLSFDAARLMQTQTSDSGLGWGYGLGFETDVVRGRRSFFHGGGGPGTGTWMRAFPEQRIAFAVLTNYFGAMAEQVGKRISAALFPDGEDIAVAPLQTTSMPERYEGAWRGTIEHHQGPLPLTLAVRGGVAEMTFGTTPGTQTLREATFGSDEMIGTAEGIVDVHAGYHGPSQLELHLRREENALRGVCHIYAKGYFELPHWVELLRA